MLQTIVTASHISVQGEFVRTMPDGRVMIKVGETFYVGNPVESFFRQPTQGQNLESVI